MHKGGRDARVPVLRRFAAVVGYADVLDVLVLPMRVLPHYGEGKPRPYNVNVFWFWAIEIPVRVPLQLSASRRRNRPAVGYPPYVGDDFSQGVALCYGLFAPLGRIYAASQQSAPSVDQRHTNLYINILDVRRVYL
jgi:hypothetical protein